MLWVNAYHLLPRIISDGTGIEKKPMKTMKQNGISQVMIRVIQEKLNEYVANEENSSYGVVLLVHELLVV